MLVKLERISSLAIHPVHGWRTAAVWRLWPDVLPADEAAVTAWHEEAAAWLPSPGDPWRKPSAAAPSGYEEDSNWQVAEVRAESGEGRAFIVSIEAAPADWEARLLGGVTEEYTAEGERIRSAAWRVSTAGLGDWLPNIGDSLQWDGGAFRCCEIRLAETSDGQWEVRIRAVDLSVEPLEAIAWRRNRDFESVKTGKWRVSAEALETFRTANEISQEAAWAGEGYYVTDFQAEPDGAGLFRVKVEARHVNVRMIEVRRHETFLGFSRKGRTRRRVLWISRWRVHRDSLGNFANITGNSALSWTGSDSVITKVDPKRLSDWEYEYILQALPRNSNMYEGGDDDDRSELEERTDLTVDISDFILSAAQCGWQRLGDGVMTAIPDWQANVECPLETDGPLPLNLVEAPLKTVTAVETRYYRVDDFSPVAHLYNWLSSGRVAFCSVGGYTSRWLKENVVTEEIIDDYGDRWQKVTSYYRLSPTGYHWNANYWGGE